MRPSNRKKSSLSLYPYFFFFSLSLLEGYNWAIKEIKEQGCEEEEEKIRRESLILSLSLSFFLSISSSLPLINLCLSFITLLLSTGKNQIERLGEKDLSSFVSEKVIGRILRSILTYHFIPSSHFFSLTLSISLHLKSVSRLNKRLNLSLTGHWIQISSFTHSLSLSILLYFSLFLS